MAQPPRNSSLKTRGRRNAYIHNLGCLDNYSHHHRRFSTLTTSISWNVQKQHDRQLKRMANIFCSANRLTRKLFPDLLAHRIWDCNSSKYILFYIRTALVTARKIFPKRRNITYMTWKEPRTRLEVWLLCGSHANTDGLECRIYEIIRLHLCETCTHTKFRRYTTDKLPVRHTCGQNESNTCRKNTDPLTDWMGQHI